MCFEPGELISFDLTRSIIRLSGVKNGDLHLDGYDIINHITREKQDLERTLFWRKKRGDIIHKAVNDGDFKYLIVRNNDTLEDEKLFRLSVDPSERNDLLDAMPEKAAELRDRLDDWEQEVSAARLTEFKEKNKIH